MSIFSQAQRAEIERLAKPREGMRLQTSTVRVDKGIQRKVDEISSEVVKYFKDSPAVLIDSEEKLSAYIDKVIKSRYAGIDTETSGLDRNKDFIVGVSLYYPNGVECYIPIKHKLPIFETLYPNQLTYEQVSNQLNRLIENNTKLIFANADFDLSFFYKDLGLDFNDNFYYDVIIGWRCIKENEPSNALKVLYAKYVEKSDGTGKRFSDFFTAELFPYCDPTVAKLYAANDAIITYKLFMWQLQFILKDHVTCKKLGLEQMSDLVWSVEMAIVPITQNLHRQGVFLDNYVVSKLQHRYDERLEKASDILSEMVDAELAKYVPAFGEKQLFKNGKQFNPNSPRHLNKLLFEIMHIKPMVAKGRGKSPTDKFALALYGLPITEQISKVKSIKTLKSTFIDAIPPQATSDSRIHAQFNQIGADCVVANTIIPTSEGYCTAIELCDTSDENEGIHQDIENLQIVNKNQEFEYAQSTIKYKNYPTIKITTENGFIIEGTYNHPIMVSNSINLSEGRYFKNLENVEIGNIVEIPCNYDTGGAYQKTNLNIIEGTHRLNANARVPKYYNEEFAEFLGMYHADGHSAFKQGTYCITLSNDDDDVMDRFVELSKSLFNVKAIKFLKRQAEHDASTTINCKRLGDIDNILTHGSKNKKIPNAIWKSPRSVINAYIKGLTLDSTVTIEKSSDRLRFQLSVIDELDARLIQIHLASQGILSSLGKHQLKGYVAPRLTLNADNYIRFVKQVGFIETCKIIKARPCTRNKYENIRSGNSFNLKVKSIEYNTADVFDLHVPKTHSFISNGIISHNTGRFSSKSPNLQNIPSHAQDIRHMFRATPGYVMLSSDYSAQEPRITAFVSQDQKMIETFQQDRDIYAGIASFTFGVPYENCLEFHPVTGEYQADGYKRRSEAKVILLAICYGKGVKSMADDLYGKRTDMTEEEKEKAAQGVFDKVLSSFPNLRQIMINSQNFARANGYVETILGRRRHLPEMQLPLYEFTPETGYVNPDINPLDISTLSQKDEIPERIVKALTEEFNRCKYYGQRVKRKKELSQKYHIHVTENRYKIEESKRKTLNSIIQGSAADQTKLAMLKLCNSEEWKAIGGRLLIPVHDELIAEVPIENYKRGGELLSKLMCDAAEFLPFPSKCDVTTSLRWKGLEYPCKHTKPSNLDFSSMSESEIKWIQYHLFECEYELPIHKDENGEKFKGEAGMGVDGIYSIELEQYIEDYKSYFRLSDNLETINHLERKVKIGDI